MRRGTSRQWRAHRTASRSHCSAATPCHPHHRSSPSDTRRYICALRSYRSRPPHRARRRRSPHTRPRCIARCTSVGRSFHRPAERRFDRPLHQSTHSRRPTDRPHHRCGCGSHSCHRPPSRACSGCNHRTARCPHRRSRRGTDPPPKLGTVRRAHSAAGPDPHSVDHPRRSG